MRAQFEKLRPGRFFLDEGAEALESWLRGRQWIRPREHLLAVARAGDGNMNCTLRVTLDSRSIIVKQARPWVEKYPTIEAPEERSEVEAAFYQTVAGNPAITDAMPRLLGHAPRDHVLALTDLGVSRDYTDLYAGSLLSTTELSSLCGWLRSLHGLQTSPSELLANRAMRRLNHEHVFALPFRTPNGLDLDAVTPGLGAWGTRMAMDSPLVEAAAYLGQRYLAPGSVLLHGDFYPGSWLRTLRGPHVIDPEFAFQGDPDFDWGVFAGHLLISGHPQAAVDQVLAHGGPLASAFAGVEVLRRLLGVAQLPLKADLPTKAGWVIRARDMVVHGCEGHP